MPKYRDKKIFEAMQVEFPLTIIAFTGRQEKAEKGDYLVKFNGDGVGVVKKETFERNYELDGVTWTYPQNQFVGCYSNEVMLKP